MKRALNRGFKAPEIDGEVREMIEHSCREARGDILRMTTLAGSGHPGGSMSSIEIFVTLFLLANLSPEDPFDEARDRVVVSHGHTSPGVYAALGRLGFFPIERAIAEFRKAGSFFEGHVERNLPGIEWSTGNLGQGLSAGCAFSLAAKIRGKKCNVFIVMGDGEQQKGQIAEARRFAVKYGLTDITVIIDYNRLQISGDIAHVMPQNIAGNYESDGFTVLEIDGHDVSQIYRSLGSAVSDEGAPYAILAHTVMGKGVSFMEHIHDYHGKALSREQFADAMAELGLENDLERYRIERQKTVPPYRPPKRPVIPLQIDTGSPREYGPEHASDNRSAFGAALIDMAELNACGDKTPIVVFDCDLAGSVKTEAFSKTCPHHFFESGIQEHHTAVMSGALSTAGILTFFADFGVFGICETYNQQRLNAINEANLKLVCTHLGIDVGEDGKTHQCIDYIGLLRNVFGFRIIVPADPNQTDRVIRYVARCEGNFMVGMGRSKIPVICSSSGEPLFAGGYTFVPGRADLVRDGTDGAIFSCGSMLGRAITGWEELREEGVKVKLYNLATPAEPDLEALRDAARTGLIVTYEDHNVHTGMGSVLGDALAGLGLAGTSFVKMGVAGYGSSGSPEDLYRELGLSPAHLVKTVLNNL